MSHEHHHHKFDPSKEWEREENENKKFEAMAEAREKDTEEKIAHNQRLQAEMARARKDILECNPENQPE